MEDNKEDVLISIQSGRGVGIVCSSMSTILWSWRALTQNMHSFPTVISAGLLRGAIWSDLRVVHKTKGFKNRVKPLKFKGLKNIRSRMSFGEEKWRPLLRPASSAFSVGSSMAIVNLSIYVFPLYKGRIPLEIPAHVFFEAELDSVPNRSWCSYWLKASSSPSPTLAGSMLNNYLTEDERIVQSINYTELAGFFERVSLSTDR